MAADERIQKELEAFHTRQAKAAFEAADADSVRHPARGAARCRAPTRYLPQRVDKRSHCARNAGFPSTTTMPLRFTLCVLTPCCCRTGN